MNSYNKISYKYITSCLIKIKNFIFNIIDEKKFIMYLNRNDYNNEISKIKKYKHKNNIYNFKKYNNFYYRNQNYIEYHSDQNKANKDSHTSIKKNIE